MNFVMAGTAYPCDLQHEMGLSDSIDIKWHLFVHAELKKL